MVFVSGARQSRPPNPPLEQTAAEGRAASASVRGPARLCGGDDAVTRPPRKPIPLKVRLEAALLALGLDPADVEWDHAPALGLRPVNAAGDDYDPPQHDPLYIVPRPTVRHARKTNGDPAVPLSGDKAKIAKTKRLEARHAEFRARLLAKDGHPPGPAKPSRWPKRKFPRRAK